MLCCTAAILWTINLHWSYLFLSYWTVWYRRKWSKKVVFCGNRCKALSIQNMCLVNIILLVAEIILDNWCCFSVWYQVFVFAIFSVAHFSVLLPETHSMGMGVVCFGTRNKNYCDWWIAVHVSGSLEIRWVNLPPTWQVLPCDYYAHLHWDDNVQRYIVPLQCILAFYPNYCHWIHFKQQKIIRSRNRHPSTRGQNCGSACYQVTEWAKYTIDWVFFFVCLWPPSASINHSSIYLALQGVSILRKISNKTISDMVEAS